MRPTAAPPATDVDVLLESEEQRQILEHDARSGLTASPKWLPPKYFYDDAGSVLFEEITRLPEYYPTRAEHALLNGVAADIAAAADAEVLVELGSGSSEKTRLLLDAMTDAGALTQYVPVDVSLGALRAAVPQLRQFYPELAIRGVVADFDRHLAHLPGEGRRLVALLGSTLGNYPPLPRGEFLGGLAATLNDGDTLLLGLDLVKDAGRLVAAYDDAAAVTAAFNRNVLHVLNGELGADFDPMAFDHVALWDSENEWIEMRLRAQAPMTVTIPALSLTIELAAGEEIRTEISAKFRRERIARELEAVGLRLEGWWSDDAGDYALALARR
ncbi:L-histidine N(alpha)-methyltransferase [Cumulibacter manganitolerans]|uniref:L-histidine N(alpha)-methyltransferase n=1 Tax=Cumulibacter manganitolerans TaxID=1884992 RepID=UPI001295A35D|nr:L-histidine N(alpha)-methyltransferase [Cumulibacter manganitolerans]